MPPLVLRYALRAFIAASNTSAGTIVPRIEATSASAVLRNSALAAGVKLVTGDTKVVDAGHGDGVFVNTAGIGIVDKLRALLRGSRPLVERQPNDPAVVLFTSGSEGTPKGVVLSHRNLLANAAQCLARVAATGEDKVFNVLPVFHSFGLTGGMVMPLVGGIPLYLYPSPLHYRIVPELIYQTNATILFGTDTFLSGYARTAHAYDFHNVRLIMAGAEAVKDRTRITYMERFGVRMIVGWIIAKMRVRIGSRSQCISLVQASSSSVACAGAAFSERCFR